MTSRLARWRREVAARLVGERPVPLGRTAHDRRLLRRALSSGNHGRILVVGPALAVRQAVPGLAADVAGTSPHQSDLTVCSTVRGAGSLPGARWDTVVITDAELDLDARLQAVRPASRIGGRVLVLDRGGRLRRAAEQDEAPDGLVVDDVVARGGDLLWVWRWVR